MTRLRIGRKVFVNFGGAGRKTDGAHRPAANLTDNARPGLRRISVELKTGHIDPNVARSEGHGRIGRAVLANLPIAIGSEVIVFVSRIARSGGDVPGASGIGAGSAEVNGLTI